MDGEMVEAELAAVAVEEEMTEVVEAEDGGGGTFNLTLGLTNVVTNNSGYYYTVVTSIGGSVTSSPISIVISFPPSNDNFTNRITLAGVNVTTAGTTAYATLETGEPAYPGLTTGGSVWWSWTAPDAGTVYITVTNTNAAFQVIQVFTGNVLTNLMPAAEVGGAQYVLSKKSYCDPRGRRASNRGRRWSVRHWIGPAISGRQCSAGNFSAARQYDGCSWWIHFFPGGCGRGRGALLSMVF